MKYRLPVEFIDIVDVASSQKTDLSRHHVKDYDADELLKYVAGMFDTDTYSVEDGVVVNNFGSGNRAYRVLKIKFVDGGDIRLFGDDLNVDYSKYVVLKKSEYDDLTKVPDDVDLGKAEEIDDDLSDIPI